ncbi:MAG: copper homeostasis protein CutC, partial [Longicatena caecimuris]|uniref:copper homeostasis protein CutC n=1 Tax=Longicatena caecimuris TaxID=1796635 RepID=UPI00399993EA
DMDRAMEKFISLGVDRVLTSGGQPNVEKGSEMLAHLQETYGSQMEILAGCGVNEMNAKDLIEITKVQQLHSSCKVWKNDPTTIGKQVSYAYAAAPHEMAYDVVSEERVRALRKAMM